MTKKLTSIEGIPGRVERTWLHTNADGKPVFTVDTEQDVAPVFKHVNRLSEAPKDKDTRYIGSVPATLLEEACKIKAREWGVKKGDAFREIMQGKTDRAQAVWTTLLQDRDYRKLQAQ